MADGVAITAGSGTTVATDDCGAAGHAQIAKLAISADGSATAIPADATDGLRVHESRAATATLANVSGSASSVTLQASNTARRGLVIVNDSTVNLYVKFGSTASATSFTYKLPPGATLELPVPIYTGIVTGIWDSATGSARMTEITA